MAESRDEEYRENDGPEGAWWYVVAAIYVDDGDDQVRMPDLPEGTTGWTAWYGTVKGDEYSVVRSPNQISMPSKNPQITISEVLSEAGYQENPHGRVRGK